MWKKINKINQRRSLIANIKKLVQDAVHNPMGALELMNVEFSALSYYGDQNENLLVIQDIHNCIRNRVEKKWGYAGQDLKIIWVTPPADPLLMNYAETLGCSVVGSEYLINQTTPLFTTGGDPFRALADAQLQGSLMG